MIDYTLLCEMTAKTVPMYTKKVEEVYILENGVKLVKFGQGSSRTVWAVVINEQHQDFVIKTPNSARYSKCNGWEYSNFLMFKRLGLDYMFVECLEYQNDVLVMCKESNWSVCQDLTERFVKQEIKFYIEVLQRFVKVDKAPKGLYTTLGFDIYPRNVSEFLRVYDYGVPLVEIAQRG